MKKMILLSSFLAFSVFAGDRRISVNGECTVEVQPDRGSVILVAENLSPNAKAAIQQATVLHEKLRKELKASKVKDLELSKTEYNVQEITTWENNKSVSKGFQCRIGLKAVTPDIAALGEIIAIAGNVGIRSTHSLVTYLSDAKMLDEKKKCLEVAAKNAREKAEYLLKSLGEKLGDVLMIQEHGANSVQPVPMMLESPLMARAMNDKVSAPTIEASRQTIHHEVDVTFAIEH